MTDFNAPDLYKRLGEMTEEERTELLDPICEAVRGKVKLFEGAEVLANRLFALAVLDLYRDYQQQAWDRD